MPARITTIAFEGAEARRVEAEVVLTNGHISFHVVGLGDKAVAESRERVRGAFAGMGLSLPGKRIVAAMGELQLYIGIAREMKVAKIIAVAKLVSLGGAAKKQANKRDGGQECAITLVAG